MRTRQRPRRTVTFLLGVMVLSLFTTPATADSSETPWSNADLGAASPPGSASVSGSQVAVRGAGAGLGGPADSLHFAWRSFRGDAEIVARLANSDSLPPTAQAGLALRTSSDAGSPHASLVVRAREASLVHRTHGDAATQVSRARAARSDVWLRIARRGARVTAETSSNGRGWQVVGTAEVELGETLLVGLVSSSGANGSLVEAMFRQVAVNGTPVTAPDAEPDPTPTPSPEPDPSPGPSPTPEPTPDPEPAEEVLRAPEAVMAVQGSTAPGESYVEVTWDRSDARAVGYDILRDGEVVGRTEVAGDSWDDFAYRDTELVAGRLHRYQVRARGTDEEQSVPSSPVEVVVRSDAQIGAIYRVDDFAGTDLQRAQAAVNAARAAGGGIVLFGPRTYRFSGALLLAQTNNVVLRGAGKASTFIEPEFAGSTVECNQPPNLIVVRGNRERLSMELARDAAVGDRTVWLTSTAGLSAGQVLVLDEGKSGDVGTHAANGVIMDPGTGTDERNPWDASEIVEVTSTSVTLREPLSQSFSAAASLWRIGTPGRGNAIESLTVQGRSASEQTLYRLINLDHTVDFTLADVRGRWANRNYVEVKGYDIRIVGFEGMDGGPNSFSGSCKYKITIFRAANVLFTGGVMGNPAHDDNQSFITFQKAQRVVVRNSRFHGSRTYALNEHGGGGRHHLLENNYIAVGARAAFGGVFLGNSTWGFSGPAVVRNNLFEGNQRDLYLQENSYEVQFLHNTSRGTTHRVVDAYGWAGPYTDADLYGSLRLTISGNRVTDSAGDGVHLGYAGGFWYPYAGVRDVIISDNHFDVDGVAISLGGSSTTTGRFQVWGNTGSDAYVHPEFTPGSFWADNADGQRYGEPVPVAWSDAQPNAVDVPPGEAEPDPDPEPVTDPTPGAVTVVDHFEAGIDGWAAAGTATLSWERSTVHAGAGALAVTNTFGTGWSGRNVVNLASPQDRTALGDTLGVWVRIPETAPGDRWRGRIGVQDSAFTWHGLVGWTAPQVPLRKGEWTFVSWQPDPAVLADVRRLSVEVAANSSIGAGTAEVTFLVDTYEQGDALGSR
jgi:hypothetical protein